MSKDETQSLMNYAAKAKPQCAVCALPEAAAIEEAWERGVRAAAIIGWLRDVKGYTENNLPMSKQVRQHIDGNHKERRSGK